MSLLSVTAYYMFADSSPRKVLKRDLLGFQLTFISCFLNGYIIVDIGIYPWTLKILRIKKISQLCFEIFRFAPEKFFSGKVVNV